MQVSGSDPGSTDQGYRKVAEEGAAESPLRVVRASEEVFIFGSLII